MDERKINIPMFVIGFLLGVLLIFFCRQAFATAKIEGSSMLPTLENGQVVIINKLKQNYKRGDIVVFETEEHYAVKRIIGLPGETVSVINNKIHIDGNEIADYIDEIADGWGMLADGITLGNGQYIVLGDNRDNSKDSTEYGAINKNDIVGVAIIQTYNLIMMVIYGIIAGTMFAIMPVILSKIYGAIISY